MLAVIDFNRTLYDPVSATAVAGALQLLNELRNRCVRMVLLSRDEEQGGRREALEALGIAGYFDELCFTAEKSRDVFEDLMKRHRASPESTIVLGDYLHEDVRYGNAVGAFTIHFRCGKYVDLQPESALDIPNAEVARLEDAIPIICEFARMYR